MNARHPALRCPALAVLLTIFGVVAPAGAESTSAERAKPFHIYLDASQSGGSRESGLSIERGIRTAFDELDWKLAGMPVRLLVRDHRGSTPRSRSHMQEFLADDRALLVFGGMHSPPLLAQMDFTNESEILLLIPWAAAGPLTRPEAPVNWTFRLSVDDTKAGMAIVRRAFEGHGYRKPFLLLEETGWGDSNLRTMSRALKGWGATAAGVERFKWGMGLATAREMIGVAQDAGADVLILVANAEEARTFARVLVDLPASQRLPVISHWGMTGGRFYEDVGADAIAALDWEFVQTAAFSGEPGPRVRKVWERARRLFPDLAAAPSSLRAPSGFLHAYDLVQVLDAATRDLTLADDPIVSRRRIRDALERVRTPVEGLVRRYSPPFRPYSADDLDAHEALGIKDIRFGRYGARGEIRLVDPTPASKRR